VVAAVVPVFWLAGDDHDYAEASQASWIGADGTVVTATLPPRPPEAPLTPMYRQPLRAGRRGRARPTRGRPPGFRVPQATLDWLQRHYRAEATVAASYAGAMAELVAPLGVICLDSTHPAVKRAMAPHLVQALTHVADLERELDRHHQALGTTARTSGVTVGTGPRCDARSGARRDRLVADGATFVTRRSRNGSTSRPSSALRPSPHAALSQCAPAPRYWRVRFFPPSRTWPARASCAN